MRPLNLGYSPFLLQRQIHTIPKVSHEFTVLTSQLLQALQEFHSYVVVKLQNSTDS